MNVITHSISTTGAGRQSISITPDPAQNSQLPLEPPHSVRRGVIVNAEVFRYDTKNESG